MKLLRFLDDKLEEYILVASLAFIVILVFLQVIFRYVLNFSLGWSEELSRYILIWIAWISASYAVKTQSHIRVEMIQKWFSQAINKWIELFVYLVWFSFALFLAVEGTKLVMKINMTGQLSPSTEIPMWIIYLAVPIGGVLMGFRLIQQTIRILQVKNPTERG